MTITQPQTSTSQTFPRQARLLNQAQYQAVFTQSACRSSDRSLTVLARQNGNGQARLGLAIGKRCARTAVARNRIKRLVRESFRRHRAELTGLDIVVLGREAAPRETNPALFTSLQRHWQRVSEQCARS